MTDRMGGVCILSLNSYEKHGIPLKVGPVLRSHCASATLSECVGGQVGSAADEISV
jgi:hypothetical protein